MEFAVRCAVDRFDIGSKGIALVDQLLPSGLEGLYIDRTFNDNGESHVSEGALRMNLLSSPNLDLTMGES